jgi:hypothetical protein
MLELKDASLTIDGHRLFDKLSLMACDGQLTLISGPEGSGKTALIRVMLGLLPLDSGLVNVDGELLTPLSASAFRRLMVYLPQRVLAIHHSPLSPETSGLQPVWHLSPLTTHLSPHTSNPLPPTSASLPPLTPEKRILLLDDPDPVLLPRLKALSADGMTVVVASQREEYLNQSDKQIFLGNDEHHIS